MRSRARFGAGLLAAAIAATVSTAAAPAAGASSQPAVWQARSATAATAATAAASAAKARPTGAKPVVDPVQAAAKRFGLPARRIEQALVDLKLYLSKHAPGPKGSRIDLLAPDVVRVFARSLGVRPTTAAAVLKFLLAEWEKPGKGKQPPADVTAAAVRFLARELHLSTAQATKVWAALQAVSAKGELSPRNPAFVALAKGLKVTPQRLLDVLVKLKQELAKQQPGKGKGKPAGPVKPPAPAKP